ncbi:MAG: ATP synthase F0 subunit B [Candidatus Moranbacteria bacterium CG23_combo_of_CG06-09_8_20_14_all_39_10]|nr:MAG: ATP synthase F0 subunit B [Candidatus Moranbacteria bacterium CG23_combo_of_CG06-09_8_20_14_all_39_10]
MDELVKTFHIEAGMIIAQLVNFVIVFVVLYKFAYGPILKLLNERTKKIEKGLADAEASHKKLSEISEKEAAVLVEARKQAQEIIKKAEETAVTQSENIVVSAKSQTDKMLEDAKKQIEQEKEKILAEVKSEVADLVVMATEKIIHEKLDSNKDQELISKSIA